jgi:hypothetical protein
VKTRLFVAVVERVQVLEAGQLETLLACSLVSGVSQLDTDLGIGQRVICKVYTSKGDFVTQVQVEFENSIVQTKGEVRCFFRVVQPNDYFQSENATGSRLEFVSLVASTVQVNEPGHENAKIKTLQDEIAALPSEGRAARISEILSNLPL